MIHKLEKSYRSQIETALQGDTIQEWYTRKTVLVTGAAGFIGNRLCERLKRFGARVIAADIAPSPPDTDPWKTLQIDCSKPAQLRHLVANCEIAFSLAGRCGHEQSMNDPLGDMQANAEAPLSLLEACRRWAPQAHVIFTSTRQVYGKVEALPVDEARVPRPVDVNGVHKLAAEGHHRLYWEKHGLRTNVLRLTNTYGPRMRIHGEGRMFLGEWFRSVLHGEPIVLFGDGKQLRDLNHVDDVVSALLLTAMHGSHFPGEVFNLGGKEALSLQDLADLIIRLSDSRAGVRQQPFPEPLAKIQIGSYWGDFSKIRTAVGWEPRVKLEAGLRETFESLRWNSPNS